MTWHKLVDGSSFTDSTNQNSSLHQKLNLLLEYLRTSRESQQKRCGHGGWVQCSVDNVPAMRLVHLGDILNSRTDSRAFHGNTFWRLLPTKIEYDILQFVSTLYQKGFLPISSSRCLICSYTKGSEARNAWIWPPPGIVDNWHIVWDLVAVYQVSFKSHIVPNLD